MRLADVNVLVYAFREDASDHHAYRQWVDTMVDGAEPWAVSSHILSGFVRVVTHPKVFHPPAPIGLALAFADVLWSRPTSVQVMPGVRHWEIFTRLCRSANARGNLVADAWLAALAIESGCEFVTTDRDYARFEGLRWRHPLG